MGRKAAANPTLTTISALPLLRLLLPTIAVCFPSRPAHPTHPHSRTYTSYEDLCADYESGALHPADLKPSLSKHLNTILQPVGGAGVGAGWEVEFMLGGMLCLKTSLAKHFITILQPVGVRWWMGAGVGSELRVVVGVVVRNVGCHRYLQPSTSHPPPWPTHHH